MVGLREHLSSWVSSKHLFLGLMIIAIGVNFLQFRHINKRTPDNFKALHVFKDDESGNLFQTGIARGQSVRYRVGPFYYFGLISPDSTVILPSRPLHSWFELHPSLIGFGKAQKILFRDYDPVTNFEGSINSAYKVDLSHYAPMKPRRNAPMKPRRTEDLKERFSVFRRSPDARTFVVLAPKGDPGRVNPIIFVDVRLLDDALREALGRDL